MELNKLQEHWDSFPEMSLEERPVLSSELEDLAVKNPLPDDFYLKNKLMFRVITGIVLWLFTVFQLWIQFKESGPELFQQITLFLLLSYFLYFHIRLLYFADYASIFSLKLIPFLTRIETVFDKYVFSFRIISVIGGFYLLAAFQELLFLLKTSAWVSLSQNGFYKWLIITFLSISFYIFFLQTTIPKYKKMQEVVRSYKEGIIAKSKKM
ncbi:hypothetical protein ACX0G9_06690 [Flavitalea flava]